MAKSSKKVAKASAMEDFIKKVQKRDGSVVPFVFERIVIAVNKAKDASREGPGATGPPGAR